MPLTKNPLFKYYGIFEGNKIVDVNATAPSPSRDFHTVVVTDDQVIWRWWKITSRNDGSKYHPGEVIDNYEDFLFDERIQAEIIRIFGQATLDQVKAVVEGHVDFFTRLPFPIMLKILMKLGLEDIARLSNVSRTMRKVCNDNELWRKLYCRHSPSHLTIDVTELGESFGWKRLFFTNKLQLQRHIRRVRSARSARSEASDQLTEADFPDNLPEDEEDQWPHDDGSGDSYSLKTPEPLDNMHVDG